MLVVKMLNVRFHDIYQTVIVFKVLSEIHTQLAYHKYKNVSFFCRQKNGK